MSLPQPRLRSGRRPRDEAELAERIHAKSSDRIADRFERSYTDADIEKIEKRKVPWLRHQSNR